MEDLSGGEILNYLAGLDGVDLGQKDESAESAEEESASPAETRKEKRARKKREKKRRRRAFLYMKQKKPCWQIRISMWF